MAPNHISIRKIRSAFEVATKLRLIGCYCGGPKDLSTNPKHLAGFGRLRLVGQVGNLRRVGNPPIRAD